MPAVRRIFFTTRKSLKWLQPGFSQVRLKSPSKSVIIFHANSGRIQLSWSASAGLLKEFALPLSIFASKDVRPFTILTEFMNKRPPAKKPQAKIQTVKKQIPVKKIAPDRIEELVKKHLGNIGDRKSNSCNGRGLMIIRDAEVRDARGIAEGLFRRGTRTLSHDLDRHFERLPLLVQRRNLQFDPCDRGD